MTKTKIKIEKKKTPRPLADAALAQVRGSGSIHYCDYDNE